MEWEFQFVIKAAQDPGHIMEMMNAGERHDTNIEYEVTKQRID